jgi:hypothetical protein
MAFDFPNSPTEGMTFAPAGGPEYIYKNGVVKALQEAMARIEALETPA